MTSRRKSYQIAVAILSLIAPMLAVQAAFPSAAQASCRGEGVPVNRTLNEPNGDVGLLEQPVGNTCNGDNIYAFRFRSNVDGSRASVWMNINGEWEYRVGGFDQDWHYATFTDSNSAASMYYCLDGSTAYYYCGYGDNAGIFFGGTAGSPQFVNLGF